MCAAEIRLSSDYRSSYRVKVEKNQCNAGMVVWAEGPRIYYALSGQKAEMNFSTGPVDSLSVGDSQQSLATSLQP